MNKRLASVHETSEGQVSLSFIIYSVLRTNDKTAQETPQVEVL